MNIIMLDEQLYGAPSKYISGNDGSVPLEKIGPYRTPNRLCPQSLNRSNAPKVARH